MGTGWVGMSYGGAANARFPNETVRRVFIMLHRDPEVPESGGLTELDYSLDENYQGWWGYVRYEPRNGDPTAEDPDLGDVIKIEPDERVPLQPNPGWPGGPIQVDIIWSHKRDRASRG